MLEGNQEVPRVLDNVVWSLLHPGPLCTMFVLTTDTLCVRRNTWISYCVRTIRIVGIECTDFCFCRYNDSCTLSTTRISNLSVHMRSYLCKTCSQTLLGLQPPPGPGPNDLKSCRSWTFGAFQPPLPWEWTHETSQTWRESNVANATGAEFCQVFEPLHMLKGFCVVVSCVFLLAVIWENGTTWYHWKTAQLWITGRLIINQITFPIFRGCWLRNGDGNSAWQPALQHAAAKHIRVPEFQQKHHAISIIAFIIESRTKDLW